MLHTRKEEATRAIGKGGKEVGATSRARTGLALPGREDA